MSAAVNVTVTAAGFTVRVAAVVVAVDVPPHELVNTARYLLPLWATVGAVTVRVVLVAPEISLQMVPPFVLTCHWTVGVGFPLAAALKVAFWPYSTV